MLVTSLALLISATDPAGIYDRADGQRSPRGPQHLSVVPAAGADRFLVVRDDAVFEVERKGSVLEPTAAALAAGRSAKAPLVSITVKNDKTLVAGGVEWVRTKDLAPLTATSIKLVDGADSLVLGPGLVMTGRTTSSGKQSCLRGVLLQTDKEQVEATPPLVPLSFRWLGMGVECDQPALACAPVHDSLGGVNVMVKDGEVVGATLVGYMFAQTFFKPGIDAATQKALGLKGAAEAAKQAQ